MLTGKVTTIGKNPIILDVHDVGYVVHVTNSYAAAASANTTYTLYIHTHVREEAFDLYGFPNPDDLSLFELLLTVSGVGPKTALLVMDRGSAAVKKAIITADVDFFTAIPRLGRKNAQKIIIELKNKIGGISDLDLAGDDTGETKQLVRALTSMGFTRQEIGEALKHSQQGSTIEQKLRAALKYLA